MKEFEIITEENGLKVIRFPALSEIDGVRHLFSTKEGGASKGVFAECNFSYTRGDVKEDVDENYYLAAECFLGDGQSMTAVPVPLSYFVLTHQTHSTNVRRVTKEDRGKGTVYERGYTDVDGLITNEPNLILVTMHADCMPLYFVDPVHRAIGLAHSGWRGTAGGIGANVIKKMEEEFDTKAEDLVIVTGPAICETHYEVGRDVFEAFVKHYGLDCERYRLFTPSPIVKDKYCLERANRMVLERAGAAPHHIHESHLCTYCESDLFFSHRRDGEKRGNMAAMLMLK